VKAVVSGVTDFMANFSSSFAPAIVGITDLFSVPVSKRSGKASVSISLIPQHYYKIFFLST
jgi:hypothetical protein